MEPDFPEDSGERALSACPDLIALVRRGGRPPILSGARRSIRRGVDSLWWRTQACLRKPPRSVRRSRSRGTKLGVFFRVLLLTPSFPLMSPCGSRSRGIYPERPCAPVFVSFVDLNLSPLLRRREVGADCFLQGLQFGFEFGQASCLGRAAVLAFAQLHDQTLKGG